MSGSLHPRGNVGRIYHARKEGGRGLISCEECVNVEVQDKYLSESEEWMLKFVTGEKGLLEVEDPDAFKVFKRRKEKSVAGKAAPWQIRKRYRESEYTEAMVCAAQEQALWVNSIKQHIDGQDESPMCRLCGESSEMVVDLCGCPVLAKSKY